MNKAKILTDMQHKLSITLVNLSCQRTIESERVEYKAGWNPESIVHTRLPLLMIFTIWVVVMWWRD